MEFNSAATIVGAEVVKWMTHNKELFPSGSAATALTRSKIRLSSVTDDMSGCEAFVVSRWQLKRLRRSQNESHHIIVRPGLPVWYFEAVLAHELGHLYLDSLPGEVRLPNLLEEGFCQVLAYHYGLEHKHRHFALHAYHERFSGPYRHGFSFLKPVYDRGQFQCGNGLRRVVQVLRDLKQTGRAASDGKKILRS